MLIRNTEEFLRNHKGRQTDEYEKATVLVQNCGTALCRNFGGHNNCTLIGNYNALNVLRAAGELEISDEELYQVILEEASRLGYNYDKNKGLKVIFNARLTRKILKRLGIKKRVRGIYFPLKSYVLKKLDAGIPIILSIAFGYYKNHTVTVRGYEKLTNKRTGKSYYFLILSDAGDMGDTYLRYKGFGFFWISHVTFFEV